MFIDIGDWLYGVFGPYGAWGILLFVFLIFFIDAILFPTLPELFFVIAFMYNPTPIFGMQILLVAAIAEVAGICLLYFIVEKVRIPNRIKAIAGKYADFLIINDERMLLVNRVAPILPFAGAFISLIETWHLKRALLFIVLGCLIKYGIVLLMSSFFFSYFNGPDAQIYTLIFVITVMIVSILAALYRKKKKDKEKKQEGNSPENS